MVDSMQAFFGSKWTVREISKLFLRENREKTLTELAQELGRPIEQVEALVIAMATIKKKHPEKLTLTRLARLVSEASFAPPEEIAVFLTAPEAN